MPDLAAAGRRQEDREERPRLDRCGRAIRRTRSIRTRLWMERSAQRRSRPDLASGSSTAPQRRLRPRGRPRIVAGPALPAHQFDGPAPSRRGRFRSRRCPPARRLQPVQPASVLVVLLDHLGRIVDQAGEPVRRPERQARIGRGPRQLPPSCRARTVSTSLARLHLYMGWWIDADDRIGWYDLLHRRRRNLLLRRRRRGELD